LYGSECWALSRVDARKVDALDQWCLRRILDIRWYHRVSNCKVRRLTEQPPLTSIIQKKRLTLFGHLVRMDESTDARRILTAVPQSEWRRPVGWPYISWMATLKNDLARHNLALEDAIELALNKPLWRILAASEATHWWCMPNNDDEWQDFKIVKHQRWTVSDSTGMHDSYWMMSTSISTYHVTALLSWW